MFNFKLSDIVFINSIICRFILILVKLDLTVDTYRLVFKIKKFKLFGSSEQSFRLFNFLMKKYLNIHYLRQITIKNNLSIKKHWLNSYTLSEVKYDA